METGELEQVGWCGLADQGIVEGKRRRMAMYADMNHKKDLVDRLKRAVADHSRGVLPRGGHVSVEQWLDSWLRGLEGTIRPRTLEGYEVIIRRHLGPAIGKKRLAKLTPSEVEAMLSAKVKAGASPRSAHHMRAVLRTALTVAERDGIVSRNVASLARPPRVVKKNEMRSLTPAQVDAFLEAIKNERLKAMYVVTLGLGLRQGEVLGLRWQDIDLDASILSVTHALQWIRPRGEHASVPQLVEPKSEESHRTLRLPKSVVVALREHRARWRHEKLALGGRWVDEWDLVFTGPFGEPLNPRTVWEGFKAVLKRAQLPTEIRFHDLRHSAASLLGAKHVPARVVQKILGHSSISLTLQTYSHVFAEQHEEAAEIMDAILGGA
jgi:integrase